MFTKPKTLDKPAVAVSRCIHCDELKGQRDCKWIKCLKCGKYAHSKCCRLAGLKSAPEDINFFCDWCTDEILKKDNDNNDDKGNTTSGACGGGDVGNRSNRELIDDLRETKQQVKDLMREMVELKQMMKNHIGNMKEMVNETITETVGAFRTQVGVSRIIC